MASITINFPDDQQQRIRDALCDYRGYRAKLDDGSDNPVGRAAFAKDVIKSLIRDVVRHQEREKALRAADAVADPDLT